MSPSLALCSSLLAVVALLLAAVSRSQVNTRVWPGDKSIGAQGEDELQPGESEMEPLLFSSYARWPPVDAARFGAHNLKVREAKQSGGGRRESAAGPHSAGEAYGLLLAVRLVDMPSGTQLVFARHDQSQRKERDQADRSIGKRDKRGWPARAGRATSSGLTLSDVRVHLKSVKILSRAARRERALSFCKITAQQQQQQQHGNNFCF